MKARAGAVTAAVAIAGILATGLVTVTASGTMHATRPGVMQRCFPRFGATAATHGNDGSVGFV